MLLLLVPLLRLIALSKKLLPVLLSLVLFTTSKYTHPLIVLSIVC